MNLYEQWLQKADDIGLNVIENVPFESQAKGLICGDCIGLNQNIETTAEKTCVLAEELGHYYTGAGDILDPTSAGNRKQELHGRIYAYNKVIGLMGIVDAYKNHCQSFSDTAEHLNVPEEFLAEALSYYKSKYGVSTTLDNYIIYFEPTIAVLELIE